MISANELRIGNWVDAKGHGPLQMKPHILSYVIRGTFPIGDYSPIHLTPEILEKAGFVKQGKDWYYKFEENFRLEYVEYLGESNYFMKGYKYTHAPIKYLHQLQNLYFALTQTELTIDL